LEVQVSADNITYETMTPRQRIGAAGNALNAQMVKGGRYLNTFGVGQFGSLATAAYSRFGTNTSTHGLATASQALFSSSTEFDGQVYIDSGASISLNLEVTGYASASALFGAGLSSCSSSVSKLLWNSATGRFSCGTDSTGSGGALIDVAELGGAFGSLVSSVSFSGAHFNIAPGSVANEAIVTLDWISGPASRAMANTWSALNIFNAGASISSNLEVAGTASVSSLRLGFLTGVLKATAGVVSTATSGVDYEVPLTFSGGLSRSVNSIAVAAGYEIPVTASTSAWESFRDIPSSRITAGTNLAWEVRVLVDGESVA
jgi:hypothetical protein